MPNEPAAERRRDDHLRVTCKQCGARVLTRRSGAMLDHRLADGAMCSGSRTWDYVTEVAPSRK